MPQNLGGCYNLYWAVLSTVNRNKVHMTYSVLCMSAVYDVKQTTDHGVQIYIIILCVSL